ncbi:MAG: hypothetical protein IMZ65_02015 [Planctomycetes bacterium]|nr:hypothetical protein [Planctomycetota bacterium]
MKCRRMLAAAVLALLGLVVACQVESAVPAAAPRPAAAAPSAAPAPTVIEGMPAGVLRPANPCKPGEVPESVKRSGQTFALNIAPRDHAPEHPPEGWCGEVAVQEALLFHGAYVPQKLINAAGRPKHPDLYSDEIPTALRNLGAAFQVCGQESRDFTPFLAWMTACLEQGTPVLIGVKINPTKHPEWGLDHFMLAVGRTPDSLVYNTTWGKQETRTTTLLFSSEEGFSFKNRSNAYYGIAIAGMGRAEEGGATVRAFVAGEDAKRMGVIVKCENLQPKARYVVYKVSSLDQKKAKPLAVFVAAETAYAFRDTIPTGEPSIYRCRRVAGP